MRKIASNGATVTNEFTEGNAGLGIPATVVSGDWLNDVQNEIVNIVEGAGITLGAPQTQLLAAVKKLIGLGGSLAPILQAIANNQAAPAVVTGFPVISKVVSQSVEFLYSIYRKTDSGNVLETGRCYLSFNAALGAWNITKIVAGDESGVDLSLIVDGVDTNLYHLNYVSDDLTGSSYSGSLRITDIKYLQL